MPIYRDQLEAVRKLIEKPEAWGQRQYHSIGGGGPYCLSGAFRAVCETSYRDDAEKELAEALGLPASHPNEHHFVSIWVWNDAQDRTHAEVLALLDSAIERAPVRPV